MVFFRSTSFDASGFEAFSMARSAWEASENPSAFERRLTFFRRLFSLDLGNDDLYHSQDQLTPVGIVPLTSVTFLSLLRSKIHFVFFKSVDKNVIVNVP